MPRRERLSPAQRATLLGIPTDREDLARYYTLTARDRDLLGSKRSDRNRLGFAVQLALLRHPGQALGPEAEPPAELVAFLARQLQVPAASWDEYACRDETRREHALELQGALGLRTLTVPEYRKLRRWLMDLALRTHKPMALAEQLVNRLRSDRIIVPAIQVVDRLCGEALARGTRALYGALAGTLDEDARKRLDALLTPIPGSRTIVLTWLRQPPGEARPGPMLRHLSRLARLRELALPPGIGERAHAGRLAGLAREGAQMSIQHLRDLEASRRYATLVALVIDTEATVTDQILEQHDRLLGRIFAEARRKHEQRFSAAGKDINDKVRLYSVVGHALIDARTAGGDAFAALEAVIPWDRYLQSVADADELARPAAFDSLPLVGESHRQVRRYAPRLLETFDFQAAPVAKDVLDGIKTLQTLYRDRKRVLPEDAPLGFVRKSWEPYVIRPRRTYRAKSVLLMSRRTRYCAPNNEQSVLIQ